MPVLQYEVFDDNGYLIGRCDFAWPERRTLGEFDGRMKYGRLRRPGETVEEAVHREKLREDALRDQGWQMARWVWDDLRSPQVIADRIRRAFARAGTRDRSLSPTGDLARVRRICSSLETRARATIPSENRPRRAPHSANPLRRIGPSYRAVRRAESLSQIVAIR